ncbi:MAG: hypothetical protein H6618_03685 [Deltaproteobacteria bacterium]|nr:hypothetical protein [Deltaproteobacteria bacterium]
MKLTTFLLPGTFPYAWCKAIHFYRLLTLCLWILSNRSYALTDVSADLHLSAGLHYTEQQSELPATGKAKTTLHSRLAYPETEILMNKEILRSSILSFDISAWSQLRRIPDPSASDAVPEANSGFSLSGCIQGGRYTETGFYALTEDYRTKQETSPVAGERWMQVSLLRIWAGYQSHPVLFFALFCDFFQQWYPDDQKLSMQSWKQGTKLRYQSPGILMELTLPHESKVKIRMEKASHHYLNPWDGYDRLATTADIELAPLSGVTVSLRTAYYQDHYREIYMSGYPPSEVQRKDMGFLAEIRGSYTLSHDQKLTFFLNDNRNIQKQLPGKSYVIQSAGVMLTWCPIQEEGKGPLSRKIRHRPQPPKKKSSSVWPQINSYKA